MPSGEHTCSWVDESLFFEEWFVEDLWDAASGMPISEVEIGESELVDAWIQGTWLTHLPDLTHPKVAPEVPRIESADLSYPILLHPEGWVMDGLHRIAKAILAGARVVSAVQFTESTLPKPRTPQRSLKLDEYRMPDGNLRKYTSVGSYPLFYVLISGDILCPSCATSEGQNIDPTEKGTYLVNCDVNWEDGKLLCDECSKRIEKAY